MKRILLMVLLAGLGATTVLAQSNWVTAYYASWALWNATPVDVGQIDYSCATHWVMFTRGPMADGNFDGSAIDPSRDRAFVNGAHAAGHKALIGTGGWGADYTGVVTHIPTAVNAIVSLMDTFGYDGVDLDWEPVPSSQATNYKAFLQALRAARPTMLITVASMGVDLNVMANQQYFDQINIMTYDMSGPWQGWVSWHNSAIYDGGNRFPSTGGLMPSIDANVNQCIAAGVPASKLGFGIEFYGYIWNGVTGPMQSGFGTVQNTVPYATIMDTYGNLPLKWDAGAQASYYSATNQFVSFDAETSITVKAKYCKSKGLGGVILYEVAAGYRGNLPVGYRDRLLQTVKQSFLGGAPPATDNTPPTVAITSPANNATLTNQVTIQATASDNVGLAGVQFQIDGSLVGNEDLTSPYSVSLNTWQHKNGAHVLSAIARDWAGNKSTATVNVTIANTGQPPVVPNKVVYDDALHSPFINTSWSATVDFSNSQYVSKNSSYSAKVSYNAWGGFDLLSGNWGAEQPIDVTQYDSLVFDAYATDQLNLTIGYYIGNSPVVSVSPNAWHTFAVGLPADPFTRFYFQSSLSTSTTVYFDNIQFKAKGVVTGSGEPTPVPKDYSLEQNYPNPFNPATTIRFSLPTPNHVTLKVYDILGKEVATLVDEEKDAGTYDVVFDAGATRVSGHQIASGVYFYQFTAGNYVETRRLMLIK